VFGAPNGLCSSITELKHIKAVKEPWRRSDRFDALSQMLLTNQRLDKLAASRVDFADRGMLRGTCLSYILEKLGTSNICSYRVILLTLSPLTGIDGSDHHSINDQPLIPTSNNDAHAGGNEDDDGEPIAGPTVLAHVDLTKTFRELLSVHCVVTVA
jgi:hypothetical protein